MLIRKHAIRGGRAKDHPWEANVFMIVFCLCLCFFSRLNASCEGHGSPWEVVWWEGGYLRQAWPPMVLLGPPPCRLVPSSSPLPLSTPQRLVFHPILAMNMIITTIMFTAIPVRLVGTTIMASAHVLLLTVIAAFVISVIVGLFVKDQLFYYSAKEGLCMNSKFKLLDFANGLNT